MYTRSQVEMFERTHGRPLRSKSDKLRRAGYRDGERRPRHRQHWANDPIASRIGARLRRR